MRRRVGIVSVGQTDLTDDGTERVTTDLVFEAARGAAEKIGFGPGDVDTVISASSDMLEGKSFGFLFALESLPSATPIHESHVEMDGAWAAYYAWLRLLAGEFSNALVVAWSKNTEADIPAVLNKQLDPLTLAPLGINHIASSGLQADAYLRRTGHSEIACDAVMQDALTKAAKHPRVTVGTSGSLDTAVVAEPIRSNHCARVADGACAIILAAEDVAAGLVPRPAWIAAAEHRIESGALGHRDLSRLPALEEARATAWRKAGWGDGDGPVVAELSASFGHEELMLREALQLNEDKTVMNPSGGSLAANALMVSGLMRLGEAALQVMGMAEGRQVDGVDRALAHASGGHALQHNLIWLLES